MFNPTKQIKIYQEKNLLIARVDSDRLQYCSVLLNNERFYFRSTIEPHIYGFLPLSPTIFQAASKFQPSRIFLFLRKELHKVHFAVFQIIENLSKNSLKITNGNLKVQPLLNMPDKQEQFLPGCQRNMQSGISLM